MECIRNTAANLWDIKNSIQPGGPVCFVVQGVISIAFCWLLRPFFNPYSVQNHPEIIDWHVKGNFAMLEQAICCTPIRQCSSNRTSSIVYDGIDVCRDLSRTIFHGLSQYTLDNNNQSKIEIKPYIAAAKMHILADETKVMAKCKDVTNPNARSIFFEWKNHLENIENKANYAMHTSSWPAHHRINTAALESFQSWLNHQSNEFAWYGWEVYREGKMGSD